MNRFAAVLIALGLLSAGAQAKEWTEIRLASEGAYPPFNTIGPNGALAGFDIDIGNALCAEMKAKCTWVKQEWDGMIPALNARKFDAIVASMSITAERQKQVDFSDKYYATPLGLVARKGSPLLPSAESLKGRKVGVQRGTVADNFATRFWEPKGVNVVRYAKQDEAYLDLASGRLEAALADALEAEGGFLAKPEGAGYAFLGSRMFGANAEEKAVIGDGVGIAVRKKDADLKAQLNKALATIRANGTYDVLRKKYFDYDIYGQ
ncbi:MAG: ABC transporter substrate-binding protein [Gammaproteobacteria bacterium]|nr:ABC transporter substrate-binding protein [Gammaproteobacteria bacterium]